MPNDVTITTETRYPHLKNNLRAEFSRLSEKEMASMSRTINSIRNTLPRDFEDKLRYLGLKNKMLYVRNVFRDEFIRVHMRKITPQKNHRRLNSLLLICNISKFDKDTPYCPDYYKLLMGRGPVK